MKFDSEAELIINLILQLQFLDKKQHFDLSQKAEKRLKVRVGVFSSGNKKYEHSQMYVLECIPKLTDKRFILLLDQIFEKKTI